MKKVSIFIYSLCSRTTTKTKTVINSKEKSSSSNSQSVFMGSKFVLAIMVEQAQNITKHSLLLTSILDFPDISVKLFSKATQPSQHPPLIHKSITRQVKLPGILP